MEESFKELQLLPSPHPTASSSSNIPPWPSDVASSIFQSSSTVDPSSDGMKLDLQLSISLRPKGFKQPMMRPPEEMGCVKAVRCQAAEQIRLASAEKVYAERVREMTRREMEIAQSEFAHARHIWERAREEIDNAERLMERSTTRVEATCITCHSCRQKFRP